MIDEFNIFAKNSRNYIKNSGKTPVFHVIWHKPMQTLNYIFCIFSHQTTNSKGKKYGSRDFQNSIHRTSMLTVCVCATLQKGSNKILNSIKNNSSNFLRYFRSMLFGLKLHNKYVLWSQRTTFGLMVSNYIVSMFFGLKLHSRGILL